MKVRFDNLNFLELMTLHRALKSALKNNVLDFFETHNAKAIKKEIEQILNTKFPSDALDEYLNS